MLASLWRSISSTAAVAAQATSPGRDPSTVHVFDPTYGYTLKDLLAVQAPMAPADFAAFWQPRYAKALATPPRPSIEPGVRVGGHMVHVVRFDGVGGKRLGAYLVVPVDKKPDNVVVYLHGYGGCGAPNAAAIAENSPTTASLYLCVRGFNLSADPAIPSDPQKHVVQGIGSRDTYIMADAVADVWSAANAALAAVPTARGRLYLDGTSFGGGLGALALAFDRRFAKAYLQVPTFGDQPLRLELPTLGSGRGVHAHVTRFHDKATVLRTLSYFDAASAARLIRVPTHVSAALSDVAVAPPGQFAIYNALSAPKGLTVMSQGHTPLPASELREILATRRAWFGFDKQES